MEPIRPDSDEVAARKNEIRRTERGSAERPSRGTSARDAGRPAETRPRKRSSITMVVLVGVLVLIGGWLMAQQYQTIQQLQSDLGEAQDWINRSKLSLARFEGRLSEADRELLESGSEITEKLAFLDSEMRKLWGVSNDRNRKAIEANKKATDFLEKKTDYLDKQRAEQRQLLAAQSEQLQSVQANVEAFQQSMQTMQEGVQALEQRLATMADRQQENAELAAANSETVETLQAGQSELQSRVNTLTQRQTLSLDELRARIASVERKLAAADNQSAVEGLQDRFAELKNVVDSIDASRSQITSRLLQLEERLQDASGT